MHYFSIVRTTDGNSYVAYDSLGISSRYSLISIQISDGGGDSYKWCGRGESGIWCYKHTNHSTTADTITFMPNTELRFSVLYVDQMTFK